MKLFVRAVFLASVVFTVATLAAALAPKADPRSPYASALSLAGIDEAQAAHPPIGPGCQRSCSTTGCVWIQYRLSSCYVMGPENCIEEPCQ